MHVLSRLVCGFWCVHSTHIRFLLDAGNIIGQLSLESSRRLINTAVSHYAARIEKLLHLSHDEFHGPWQKNMRYHMYGIPGRCSLFTVKGQGKAHFGYRRRSARGLLWMRAIRDAVSRGSEGSQTRYNVGLAF